MKICKEYREILKEGHRVSKQLFRQHNESAVVVVGALVLMSTILIAAILNGGSL